MFLVGSKERIWTMSAHSTILLTILFGGSFEVKVEQMAYYILLGFPCSSAGKESACNVGDLGLIHGLGRSSGEGKGYPFQYSGQKNSMDCIVYGVAKSQIQLSDFHFHVVRNFLKLYRDWAGLCFPNFLNDESFLAFLSFFPRSWFNTSVLRV